MIWNHVSIERISQKIGCKPNTVRVYLGRGEFAHIHKIHSRHRAFINNITDSDISRIKELYENALARRKNKERLKNG